MAKAEGKVVHCKKEPYDILIDRTTKWGNPFRLTGNSTEERRSVIDKYEAWLCSKPTLLAMLPELKGKTLGCWCKPLLCHGDVLVRLANKD